MNTIYYGDFRLSDEKDSILHIDTECAACRHKAMQIAVSDVLAAVIKNELTEVEETVIRLRWFDGYKNSRIASILAVTPDSVRKALKRAEKKIYASLKYVVLYDNLVGCDDELPTDFHFKIVSCINGKELIS